MEFIDVVFPLNLGPLTYRCPEHLKDKAVPGMLVSAPLKKQTAKGIILSKSSPTAHCTLHPIRSINDVHGESPLLEQPMLSLLNWMSDYYLANKGIVLKNMLPREAFNPVKARKAPPLAEEGLVLGKSAVDGRLIDENTFKKVNDSIIKKDYKTFLLHAPSSSYELSFFLMLIQSKQNTIILVPELMHIADIASVIKEIAGERLCVLHSGLSKGQRSAAYEKIISGQCSVVIGTRMAVFAPFKNVSLVTVLQEHSNSYKTEEGLRYNARDIAVMRGYLEKATVVLSSICPSIESIYNANQGKYSLLKPDVVVHRPKIKVINMYQEKQTSPNLSKTVIDATASAIKKNEKIMFVINRKGYSMLTCKECGHTETCDKCGIPLVFHKDDKSLRCHYCGFKTPSPEKCKRCGSFDIELTGAGIQRIEENLKKIFNLAPVRIDSDIIKRKIKSEQLSEMIKGEALIIGTKLLTRRLQGAEDFSIAAVLNVDMYMNLPDFRSAEKAYQELAVISDKIKPGGTLFIQTRMPQSYLFKFFKNDDYYGFCQEELLRRKAVSYPPFSRIALITLKGKDYDDNKVKNLIKNNLPIVPGYKSSLPPFSKGGIIEILGPSAALDKKGEREYSVLLKSASKQKLHSSIKEFLKKAAGHKDLEINVAIDP